MGAGRKPKPIEMKIMEGNPGRRPLPDTVVVGGRPAEMPPPPEYLDEAGVEFWAECVQALHTLGILDRVDGAALEMAAMSYSRWHQARRVIAKQGLLARGSTGQLVEHPMVATERKEAALYLRFAEQYGLTSAARARLGIAMLHGQSLQNELDSQLGDTDYTPA